MEILKASQSELLGTIAKVAGIVPNRSTLPIIQNIFIRKNGNEHEFVATDIDAQITTLANFGGDNDSFATTISASKLIGLLKTLPSDQVVSLVASGSKVIMKAGRSRFSLQTISADDFPMFRETKENELSFSVSEKTFASLIDQVYYAQADGDVRGFLNGMFIETKENSLIAVASNGLRLAFAKARIDNILVGQNAIIPRKSVLELHKLLGRSDEYVNISLAGNYAKFEFKGIQFLTRLVSGAYVAYERAIPGKLDESVLVNRSIFLSALRRGALVLDDKVKAVRLKFTTGLMTVISDSGDEDGEQELEVEYNGPEILMGVPVAQVADGLSNFSNEMVRLGFSHGSALVMTYEELPDYKYIVSPMRI